MLVRRPDSLLMNGYLVVEKVLTCVFIFSLQNHEIWNLIDWLKAERVFFRYCVVFRGRDVMMIV